MDNVSCSSRSLRLSQQRLAKVSCASSCLSLLPLSCIMGLSPNRLANHIPHLNCDKFNLSLSLSIICIYIYICIYTYVYTISHYLPICYQLWLLLWMEEILHRLVDGLSDYPIIVPLFTMFHDSLPIVGALLHPSP